MLNERLKRSITTKTTQRFIAAVLLLLVGGAAGFLLRGAYEERQENGSFVEQREGEFKLINPLLECDAASTAMRNRELRPFQDKVESSVKYFIGSGFASNVTVYFRELHDGHWFSIGETERFTPASLRKVPLMITLLKHAERDKGFLAQRVPFRLSRDFNENQNIKPSQAMVPGREYVVGDLLYRMIAYSDNNAFMLLTKFVDPAALENVYTTLRIGRPDIPQDDQFLSVQTYASFFRVLYNATYLNKEMSDLALDMLSKSEFRSGIVAGVPPEITVAHKFGEHSDQDRSVQLHDCGIVYYPRHPYLLCVMSKGPNFETLDDVIEGVSRVVFAEVDRQQRNH